MTSPPALAAATIGLAETSYHHGSHNGLLCTPFVEAVAGRIDAIIVPTARPVVYLPEALSLAGRLGCPVVALCSGWADAGRTVDLAVRAGVEAVAVDVGGRLTLPSFRTSSMLTGRELRRFARRTDTSLKRNIGLVLARMMGWKRVLFLDDDILIENPGHVREAAGLLDTYDAVGLANAGYPDNSVVCHAYRAVGGDQDTFIGGGALAVATDRAASFFPNIYNEDWFFLLNDNRLSPVATTGKADQKPYDPFRDPRRARAEEFGDTLAEGVYALLDDGKRVQDADGPFWQSYLDRRRRFLEHILRRVPGLDLPGGERERMTASLRAALGRQQHITPELCMAYLQAWRGDRKRWKTFLEYVPQVGSADKAFEHLGLRAYGTA